MVTGIEVHGDGVTVRSPTVEWGYAEMQFFYTAANENLTANNGTWWPEQGSPPAVTPYRSPSTATPSDQTQPSA